MGGELIIYPRLSRSLHDHPTFLPFMVYYDYDLPRRSPTPVVRFTSAVPSPPRNRNASAVPPSKPHHAPQAVEPTRVLGVFGLSIRTRERDLEDEFGKWGDVEKVIIVYDQRVSPLLFTSMPCLFIQTDRSRGFGFITMRTVEDANRCIEKLNGLTLHGRSMRVDYSATQRPHAPTPGQYLGERRPLSEPRAISNGSG